MILLLLQMGGSNIPGLSSDSLESESSSWIANSTDWDYEPEETDPEIIFISHIDSDDMMGLVGYEDVNTVSDAESVVGTLSVTEAQGDRPDDEIETQGRMFFEGI